MLSQDPQDILACEALLAFDLSQQEEAEPELSQGERGSLGHLYHLQGTSEPFATHLWNFWISDVGPGRLKGKTLKCIHSVSKDRPIDLDVLWREVNERGGSDAVGATKGWAAIGRCFNPSPTCTSLSYNIRRVYEHALSSLEFLIRHKGLKVEGVQLPEVVLAKVNAARKQQSHKSSRQAQGEALYARRLRKRPSLQSPSNLHERAPKLDYKGIAKEKDGDDDPSTSTTPPVQQRDQAGQVMYKQLEKFYNGTEVEARRGRRTLIGFDPKASEQMFGQVSQKVITRYCSNYDLSQKSKVYDDYVEVDGMKIRQCSKSPVVAFMENQRVPKKPKQNA